MKAQGRRAAVKSGVEVLRNPHTLPMVIEVLSGGMVQATFPAVPGCKGTSMNPDPWKARDEAILDCARDIVIRLQTTESAP